MRWFEVAGRGDRGGRALDEAALPRGRRARDGALHPGGRPDRHLVARGGGPADPAALEAASRHARVSDTRSARAAAPGDLSFRQRSGSSTVLRSLASPFVVGMKAGQRAPPKGQEWTTPPFLVAGYLPDDFDPSWMDEAVGREIHALNEEMIAAGVRKFACGLVSAKSLRTQADGGTLVADGPYLETKEHIGGFWILNASPDSQPRWSSERRPSGDRGGGDDRVHTHHRRDCWRHPRRWPGRGAEEGNARDVPRGLARGGHPRQTRGGSYRDPSMVPDSSRSAPGRHRNEAGLAARETTQPEKVSAASCRHLRRRTACFRAVSSEEGTTSSSGAPEPLWWYRRRP